MTGSKTRHTQFGLTGALWCGAAVLFCGLALGQLVNADEAEDEVEVPVNAATENWLTEENFNQWVFSPSGGGGRGQAEYTRTRLTDFANSEIEKVDRMFGLTAPQRRKLELAARIDINRLFDRVDAARNQWMRAKNKKADFQAFWRDVQQLQFAVATEKLGAGSMYRKTLLRTLNSDQITKYYASERARRERRNRARVSSAVVLLETFVPLESSQRKRLSELIEQETANLADTGRYQTHVILYRTSKIPEAKVKAILDPVQLRIFQSKLQEYQATGQWLGQQGLLRDEPRDVEELSKSETNGK